MAIWSSNGDQMEPIVGLVTTWMSGGAKVSPSGDQTFDNGLRMAYSGGTSGPHVGLLTCTSSGRERFAAG
jgi:hypothetical protein